MKRNILSSIKEKFTLKNFYTQLKSMGSTILVVLLITSAVVEGSLVPTSSMEGTMLVGDRLFINKFIYGASSPRYIPFTDIELPYFQLPSIRAPEVNDIVVFRYPGDLNQLEDDAYEHWVKRCIGTPGDVVEIKNRVVFVNGEQLPIPPNIQYENRNVKQKGWTHPDIYPKGKNWNDDNYGPLVIPRKGDVVDLTKNNIEQWRTIIDREYGDKVVKVLGDDIYLNDKKATFYTLTEDYYFMVGDNRDNSLDSRFWGFVPRENIVGTPIFIFWSWNSGIPFYKFLDLIGSVRFERLAKIVK